MAGRINRCQESSVANASFVVAGGKGTLVDWCEKQRRKLRAQGSLGSLCLDGLRNVAAQETSETTNSLVRTRWQVSHDLPALHCKTETQSYKIGNKLSGKVCMTMIFPTPLFLEIHS